MVGGRRLRRQAGRDRAVMALVVAANYRAETAVLAADVLELRSEVVAVLAELGGAAAEMKAMVTGA